MSAPAKRPRHTFGVRHDDPLSDLGPEVRVVELRSRQTKRAHSHMPRNGPQQSAPSMRPAIILRSNLQLYCVQYKVFTPVDLREVALDPALERLRRRSS